MVDTKKKGKKYTCEQCGKRTQHIPAGTNEKNNLSKDDYGRTHTAKIVWFQCIECGDYKLISRW